MPSGATTIISRSRSGKGSNPLSDILLFVKTLFETDMPVGGKLRTRTPNAFIDRARRFIPQQPPTLPSESLFSKYDTGVFTNFHRAIDITIQDARELREDILWALGVHKLKTQGVPTSPSTKNLLPALGSAAGGTVTAGFIIAASLMLGHPTAAPTTVPAPAHQNVAVSATQLSTASVDINQQAKAELTKFQASETYAHSSEKVQHIVDRALSTGSAHLTAAAFQSAARQIGNERGAQEAHKFLTVAAQFDQAHFQQVGKNVFKMTVRDLNDWKSPTVLSRPASYTLALQ